MQRRQAAQFFRGRSSARRRFTFPNRYRVEDFAPAEVGFEYVVYGEFEAALIDRCRRLVGVVLVAVLGTGRVGGRVCVRRVCRRGVVEWTRRLVSENKYCY